MKLFEQRYQWFLSRARYRRLPGALAPKTTVQVYFWDIRQFEELAKAIGRHLNSIVMPQTEQYLRGLAWLFPPEELLEEDEITLANPLTFMKSVIQRDLRLPVPHCLTLFNVAESYHSEHFSRRYADSKRPRCQI